MGGGFRRPPVLPPTPGSAGRVTPRGNSPVTAPKPPPPNPEVVHQQNLAKSRFQTVSPQWTQFQRQQTPGGVLGRPTTSNAAFGTPFDRRVPSAINDNAAHAVHAAATFALAPLQTLTTYFGHTDLGATGFLATLNTPAANTTYLPFPSTRAANDNGRAAAPLHSGSSGHSGTGVFHGLGDLGIQAAQGNRDAFNQLQTALRDSPVRPTNRDYAAGLSQMAAIARGVAGSQSESGVGMRREALNLIQTMAESGNRFAVRAFMALKQKTWPYAQEHIDFLVTLTNQSMRPENPTARPVLEDALEAMSTLMLRPTTQPPEKHHRQQLFDQLILLMNDAEFPHRDLVAKNLAKIADPSEDQSLEFGPRALEELTAARQRGSKEANGSLQKLSMKAEYPMTTIQVATIVESGNPASTGLVQSMVKSLIDIILPQLRANPTRHPFATTQLHDTLMLLMSSLGKKKLGALSTEAEETLMTLLKTMKKKDMRGFLKDFFGDARDEHRSETLKYLLAYLEKIAKINPKTGKSLDSKAEKILEIVQDFLGAKSPNRTPSFGDTMRKLFSAA